MSRNEEERRNSLNRQRSEEFVTPSILQSLPIINRKANTINHNRSFASQGSDGPLAGENGPAIIIPPPPLVTPTPPSKIPPPPPKIPKPPSASPSPPQEDAPPEHKIESDLVQALSQSSSIDCEPNKKLMNIEFIFLKPKIITQVIRQPAAKVEVRPKGPKMLVHKCPEPPATVPAPPIIAEEEVEVPEDKNQLEIQQTPQKSFEEPIARKTKHVKGDEKKIKSTNIQSPTIPAQSINVQHVDMEKGHSHPAQQKTSSHSKVNIVSTPSPEITERMKNLKSSHENIPKREQPPSQLTTSSIKEKMAMLRNSGLEKALAGGGVRQVKTVKAQQYSAEELAQKPQFMAIMGHKPLNPINRPNASTKEEVVVPGKPILRNVRPNNKRRPPTMKF